MILDNPPPSLTATAWSNARNVSFGKRGAARSPYFVGLLTTNDIGGSATQALAAKRFSTDKFDDTFVFGLDGRCGLLNGPGKYADRTPSGYTPALPDQITPMTTCSMAGLLYVNRQDLGIRYVANAQDNFAPIPNLDSAWTCLSLRSYKDFLIALNVTKAGVAYENLVKWSDATLAGQVPSNWDYTLSGANKSSLAGENPLAEMNGPILDGGTLGDSFIIYGRDEVWQMNYTGSEETVFTFRRLFSEGIMNTNCSIEVNGTHFVFGRNKMYYHDGITPTPIQLKENNASVFSRVDTSRERSCFVTHDFNNTTILFCYATTGNDYCNEALAYNYVTGTASLIDMPNVLSAEAATPYGWASWADSGSETWAYDASQDTGESWESDSNVYSPSLLFAGVGASNGSVWLYTEPKGGQKYDPANNSPMVLERLGICLDEIQLSEANIPLRSGKMLREMVPLIGEASGTFKLEACGQMLTTDTPNWRTLSDAYDPQASYWVGGFRTVGRYLGIRVTVPTGNQLEFLGYDMTVVGYGLR